VQLSQRTPHFVMLGLVGLMTVACAKNQEAAKQALAEIDHFAKQASTDAPKYLPEQAAIVQGKVATLKTSFDLKDYSAVLAGSPAVLADAKSLVAAVSAKKREATARLVREWTTLDASLPPLVAAVRMRIDILTRTKRPRNGVDLSRAKASFADGNALWDKAESAYESGQLENAVALLKDAKPKAEAAAAALQLTHPGTD
jgi:hypothetical protein